MHILSTATLFLVLTLIGVEFSVLAFVHPAARRLDPGPQLQMLSRFALVLGKVMPVWYPLCTLLLALQTWLHWHTSGRAPLLAADALWVLASVASLFLLVPLNTRIAQAAPDWQTIHHTWDTRHRIRTAVLAIAAILLTSALVA